MATKWGRQSNASLIETTVAKIALPSKVISGMAANSELSGFESFTGEYISVNYLDKNTESPRSSVAVGGSQAYSSRPNQNDSSPGFFSSTTSLACPNLSAAKDAVESTAPILSKRG